jgi:hypothetical protein
VVRRSIAHVHQPGFNAIRHEQAPGDEQTTNTHEERYRSTKQLDKRWLIEGWAGGLIGGSPTLALREPIGVPCTLRKPIPDRAANVRNDDSSPVGHRCIQPTTCTAANLRPEPTKTASSASGRSIFSGNGHRDAR